MIRWANLALDAVYKAMGRQHGSGTGDRDWRTTRYAADCKAPCTPGALVVPGLTEASIAGRAAGRFVPLTADGLESLPSTNNVDFRFGKWFKVGRFDVQGLEALQQHSVVSLDRIRSTDERQGNVGAHLLAQ